MTVVSSTSIAVNWSSPTETGGRSDLYYQVEYSDPENLGGFTGAVYLNELTTSHTFTALRPYTSYCIRVSVHNGVSDQDPYRSQSRIVEDCTMTPEDSECFCSSYTWYSGMRTPLNIYTLVLSQILIAPVCCAGTCQISENFLLSPFCPH